MRNLIVLRGAPGSGKSTFLEKNNLKQYALSPDEIRLQVQAPILLPNGRYGISQQNERLVWNLLFKFLELRMGRGDLTIIDATHSKTSDFAAYKKLAEKYKYRIFVIDFSKAPLDVCLKQNQMRADYKWVPDERIKVIYERFATQPVPNYVKVIKPEEVWDYLT
jgi:predicted kinase